MLGGQVNRIISIIIDNNSNNNYSTELFSAPISQVGAEESVHINCSVLASRESTQFLRGRLRDHEIVSVKARVRSDGITYWNLPAISNI